MLSELGFIKERREGDETVYILTEEGKRFLSDIHSPWDYMLLVLGENGILFHTQKEAKLESEDDTPMFRVSYDTIARFFMRTVLDLEIEHVLRFVSELYGKNYRIFNWRDNRYILKNEGKRSWSGCGLG